MGNVTGEPKHLESIKLGNAFRGSGAHVKVAEIISFGASGSAKYSFGTKHKKGRKNVQHILFWNHLSFQRTSRRQGQNKYWHNSLSCCMNQRWPVSWISVLYNYWGTQLAVCSPLVIIIIVVLCVVILAWVDTWLHGEFLHFTEADKEITQRSLG